MKLKHAFVRLLMLQIILTAIPMTPVHIATAQDNKAPADESVEDGLRFRLSEGSERIEKPKPTQLAPATPLSEA
ncbi:MAG TPA: hypothetical protein VF766_01105, partial [Pyrinomonadaceae bacterium]